MYLLCRLKVTQVNLKVSGLVGLFFGLFASVFLVFGQYASLYGVCRVVRPWRGIGSQHAFRRNGRGRLGCLSAFRCLTKFGIAPSDILQDFF